MLTFHTPFQIDNERGLLWNFSSYGGCFAWSKLHSLWTHTRSCTSVFFLDHFNPVFRNKYTMTRFFHILYRMLKLQPKTAQLRVCIEHIAVEIGSTTSIDQHPPFQIVTYIYSSVKRKTNLDDIVCLKFIKPVTFTCSPVNMATVICVNGSMSIYNWWHRIFQ